MIALDGYFEGPGRDISWHKVDTEFNEFAIQQLDEIGTLLFGRVTYELMAGYWPTPTAIKDDPIVAGKMNAMEKVVFSSSLAKADWNNTRLVRESAEKEVQHLKEQNGKAVAILGSSELANSLSRVHLIDEYRIIINPVALGAGTPLFKETGGRMNLTLTKSRVFKSGNVLLYYHLA